MLSKYLKYIFMCSIPFILMNFIVLVYISNKILEIMEPSVLITSFVFSALIFILPSYYLIAFKIAPYIKLKPLYMNEDGNLEDKEGNVMNFKGEDENNESDTSDQD